MKKTVTACILLLSASLVACRKDRQCECTSSTVYHHGMFSPSTATYTDNYNKVSKREIKKICKSYTREYPNSTTRVECKLK